MLGKKLSVGLGVLGAATASLCLFSSTAFADYGPGPGDVVGVGSDTLQYASNFVNDGDFVGDGGYNSIGNINRVISIDATADANARLAYSPQGVGVTPTVPSTNACAPGTGGAIGTGNQNSTHTGDVPCTLNPTVVVRAGISPIQRPNGSGAGYTLLKNDTDASGNGKGLVDFARASSARGSNAFFDSITIGTDPLAMLVSNTTNAVPLSVSQLNLIYSCTVTTWNDPAIGGTSTATIKPLLPQIGSGTRTSFLSAISNPTVGNCVTNVEENDPEAIDSSGASVNAIEPMSGGRLNMFQGKLSTGAPNGVGGYFTDPSCAAQTTTCATPTLNPNVHFVTGTPTGSPAPGGLFNVNRPLYIYFRHNDIASGLPFQPGSSLNWVRTMLYNPCSGAGHTTGCVTIGGVQYGPGGAPYYASAGAAANISASGIVPTYAYIAGGA